MCWIFTTLWIGINNNVFTFVNGTDCANNTDEPGGALTSNQQNQ